MEDNVAIVKAFFAALNAHDLDAMDAMRGHNFASDNVAGAMDAERMRRYVQTLIAAFPDLHFELIRIVAQGDYVAVDWVANGTHNGVLRTPSRVAIPATGRPASVVGSHTFAIRGGKVARDWFYTDMASLLTQLGLMPPI